MALDKRYQPKQIEPALRDHWLRDGVYRFDPGDETRPLYAVDTPPPTVSGNLHLGHVFSYSHADFMARFFRMRGYNVFYPMGFDDNGLPTERLVEKRRGIRAAEVGRQAFIEECLRLSVEMEKDYRALWERLGLSVDWRYTYRTIDDHSRRCAQHSFIDLYNKGLVYRAQAPAIWCPECQTAISQADLNDLERESELITLPFEAADGGPALPIATTRPELLAACVAVFIHPGDARYAGRLGSELIVPLYGQRVPLLADPAADPEKGTGAVMCCTFGDQTDVAWWQTHRLPLREALDSTGRMTTAADLEGAPLAGLSTAEARARIKELLAARGLILARQAAAQAVRVHERCDTPVEYRVTPQWFIRVLEHKEKFLELGEQLRWRPAQMQARYRAWVENLNWDWCISRQRVYGPAFPVWYCRSCGALRLAGFDQLPVDPQAEQPAEPCACGSRDFAPDTDVMDTWMTSSLSPQIVSGWLRDGESFARLFPLTVRPQAHDIIRTWAFYTIVKSWYHFGRLPWRDVLISGWGLAGEGMGKISKSRGGGPAEPMEMIERYSADALRYWAASTGPGKDALINEEKIQMGARLANKLWNVARFAEPFLAGAPERPAPETLTPADRWILAGLDRLIARATAAFESYEYAQARAEVEGFFWRELADNYLEMAKLRLYDPAHLQHAGACCTLRRALITLLKLFAPLLPYVTDAIWGALFAGEGGGSIHAAAWPEAEAAEAGAAAADAAQADIETGELLVALATAVRRYKSERALSLGSELGGLQIAAGDDDLAFRLRAAVPDLLSVTRAGAVEVCAALEPGLTPLNLPGLPVQAAIREE